MLIKLTNTTGDAILIGVESIIAVKKHIINQPNGDTVLCTKIQSRGAMVETNFVIESIDEIWDMVKK